MFQQIQHSILKASFSFFLGLLVFLLSLSAAESAQEPPKRQEEGMGQGRSVVYIIQLDQTPLLKYLHDRPPSPALPKIRMGRRKHDFRAPEALDHLNRIKKQHRDFEFRARRTLVRKLDIRYSYLHAFNGVAVALKPDEAVAVADLPEVLQVQPEMVRFPLTDAGPPWIGAPAVWDIGALGEGIVIGILDTGIGPGHPSFAEIDGDGYAHTNPKLKRFGVCDEDNEAVYDPAFPCNDKLIGAWSFVDRTIDPASPRDSQGHGTHVSAMAVGNTLVTDTLNPTQFGVSLSGVAPRANIIVYDVCVADCPESATLAAIDQAVADGVDVINFSIGGPALDPWADPTSLAFLAAREAGIFVSVAAGNSGPGQGSVLSPANAPWVTAVGAATHDRRFTGQGLLLSGDGTPSSVQGTGITPSYGPAPMVYALDFGDGRCLNPFPSGTWENGEIVVCDRGIIPRVEKGLNVKAGGAGGMVLVNQATDTGLVADFHVLPAIHISFEDGNTLKGRLNTDGPGSLIGEIIGTQRILDPSSGDIMPAFSSRGPNNLVPDVLKPDLVAPGVSILSAGPPLQGENPTFSTLSGTSVSAPFVAGAASLLMSLYPDWGPDMIRSALMTTAGASGLLKDDGTSSADSFVRGAGRVDLREAVWTGLALQESSANFLAADPALGGDPRALNLPFLVDSDSSGISSWRRTFTSTLDVFSSWSVSVSGPSGMNMTPSPSSFTLAPGAAITLLVEANLQGLPENQWAFGEVVLSSLSSPQIRLPVATFLVKGRSTLGVPLGEEETPSPAVTGPGGGGGCMIGLIQTESGVRSVVYFFWAAVLLILALALRLWPEQRKAGWPHAPFHWMRRVYYYGS